MAVIGNAGTTKGKFGPPGAKPAQAQTRAPAPQAQEQKKSFGQVRPREQRGNYLKPIDGNNAATYTLRINRLKQKGKRDKDCFKKKDTFIVEAEVIESNCDLCPVGYQASFVSVDKGNFDYYFQDVKGVLCALLNAEPEQIDQDDWNAAVGRVWEEDDSNVDGGEWGAESGEQPLSGFYVKVMCKEKPTEKGTPFTEHIWSPSPTQYPELNQ